MIRLRRIGANKQPHYRIVVSESRRTPRGRYVDVLGTYDPRSEKSKVKLDVGRAEDWIRKGAHPSETVRSLIKQAKGASA